jgi:4-amino-4-deoxy-L-arabinose transferase-like glycosyltransferase
LLRGVLIGAAVFFLYFYGLSGTGVLGPDEPRYASIGRQMAMSGDWITPVLWGSPWFEKPVLLYWMTGAAFRLGLGPETAPRLPVAVLGAAFLAYFHFVLRWLCGSREALMATILLGTCGGWLAYSYVSVTDLPMAACFSAAMLTGMLWMSEPRVPLLAAAGAWMGLAVLAKGLVPLVLSAPLLWFARRHWRAWWLPLLTTTAVAAPWYVFCYLRNGRPFFDELFVKHHFSRVASDALQHVQPLWFYVPVLLAAVFPWTPVAALLLSRRLFADRHAQLFGAWVAFGFIFFSISVNKLPGYLLPLLPALCALMGIALARASKAAPPLALVVLMLGLLPGIGHILPAALEEGLSRSPWRAAPWWLAAGALPVTWLIWRPAGERHRLAVVAGCAVAMTLAVVWLKVRIFPVIDEHSTARPLARRVLAGRSQYCVERMPRAQRYSLNYYTVTPLPQCDTEPRPNRIVILDDR